MSIFKFKGVFCLQWLKVWLQWRHHKCFVPWFEFVLFYLLDSWEMVLHINWRSKYQCRETIFFLGWSHYDILGSVIQVTKEYWTKCWPFFRKVWDCSCKYTLKGKLISLRWDLGKTFICPSRFLLLCNFSFLKSAYIILLFLNIQLMNRRVRENENVRLWTSLKIIILSYKKLWK